MASNNAIIDGMTHEEIRESSSLFFGDFDQEECGKYFKQVDAVKFVKDHSKKERDCTGQDAPESDSGTQSNPVNNNVDNLAERMDSVTLNDGTVEVCDNQSGPSVIQEQPIVNESHKTSETPSKGQEQEAQEKATKGTEEGQKPHEESTPKPKQKPATWAALFKSTSDAPVSKPATIVSVQFEENAHKPPIPLTPTETNENARVIPVEKDQRAVALADYLQKSILQSGGTAMQLRGLINNGNWCYINATLQSLLGCPAFYRLFKSMKPFKQKTGKASSTPLTDTIIDFANEFSTLDPKVLNSKGKKVDDLRLGTSFEPKQVYEILSVLKSTLSETGKQQDAEEFLTFLLSGLHEEFASLKTLVQNTAKMNNHVQNNEKLVNGKMHDSDGVAGSDENRDSENENEASTDDWEQVGRNNKSASLRKTSEDDTLITRLFGGIIRSSVHHAGAKESATLQPFFTIQLDIQAENIWNITDAFENYFTKENIEGFTSSKTNSTVEASHKTSLEKLPQVLILHLKYFVYDKTGGCQKTHKHVEISKELEIPKDVLSLNLKGRVPANQRSYELFAVEFHLGKNAAGGHYTTAVRHKDPLGWVYCNDNNIQKTQFSQITKQQKDKVPYLLFYERANHFVK